MSTPHDALFKSVFSDPTHASGALKVVMPAQLATSIDWPALKLRPGSFVDPELRSQHTDLLFSTTWTDGGDALLYLLFEHQSSPDPDMAFRMLRYQVRIWERWRSEHPERSKFPVIIPVVLYHGATAWSVLRSFAAKLDVSPDMLAAVGPYVVQFCYLLDDLSDVPDEVLRERAMTALARLTEICFKHARRNIDAAGLMREHSEVVREVAEAAYGLKALELVLRYIIRAYNQVDREALKAVIKAAAGPATEDIIMTLAEEWIQEGLQKGEQGLMLRLLRMRFGDAVDASVEQRIKAATIGELEAWTARVLDAATLGEVLAD